ncbi:MAG TPA: MMPL family transporter [Acidimicrobiales bacterium]|nr:MMPL family transporter [Acidimicrobiales bacterium]
MRLSPQSMARASSRHPWRTVGIWLVLMAAAGAASGSLLSSATTTDVEMTNNPEANQAEKLLEDRLTGAERDTEIVIVRNESSTVDDPAFSSYVKALAGDLRGLGGDVVERVDTFAEAGEEAGLVSKDRHATLLPTLLAGSPEDAIDLIPKLQAVVEDRAESGFTTRIFGPAALGDDFNTVSEEDLAKGESVGILAALVILVVVFGAVVAGVVPVIIGMASIFVAVGVVSVVGQIVQFSFFVTNMISMMGLAVGIDYSLFVVSRYREERLRGKDKLDAIEATGATASRAVFFSGMTVVLALIGMILIPNSIFKSLGAGAIFVVVIAVLASLTLLPAVLGLLGDKVNALRIHRRKAVDPEHRGGFWDSVTRTVMRRPVLSLVLGVTILLACASSALDMRTGFSGVSTIPDELPSKQAFDVLARDFAGGLSSPVNIVVDGDADAPAVVASVDKLQASLAGDEIFGPPEVTVNDAGDFTLVAVPVNGDPSSKAAVDAVGRVRDEYVPAAFPKGGPARALVGGETAFNKDFFEVASRYLPIVFVFVLGLSFILLTIAFRSIVVPAKAIVMNLLSVGAAYGLIVLVSQKGVGAGILGFQQVEVIEAWLPLFLFSVLFGLSMDYHVFLLSRIREHFDQTRNNTESVAYGLRTTAGIITGAALIMVAVFSGFAAGRMVAFQQMGFGLAVAVLIDATIVRSILVPASMKLLGDRNWYLPKWLEWLPNVGVEGPAARVHDLRQAVPAGVTGTGASTNGDAPVVPVPDRGPKDDA